MIIAVMAFTALTNTFHISSAPFDGEYTFSELYDGPDIGDSDEFRGFVNARWREAQSRGHRELMLTKVEIPELTADDFPGLQWELADKLSKNQFEGANDLLDKVPDVVAARVRRHMEETAEIIFTCKQGEEVHMAISYWKPKDQQIVMTVLGLPLGQAPPGQASSGQAPQTTKTEQ